MLEKKLNTVLAGAIIGTTLPIITFYVIYRWLNKTLTLQEFVSRLMRTDLQVNIYIWSLIPVFIVFGVFYHKEWDYGLKGILIPTFIYVIAVVISNF